jgi:hypothetical protein
LQNRRYLLVVGDLEDRRFRLLQARKPLGKRRQLLLLLRPSKNGPKNDLRVRAGALRKPFLDHVDVEIGGGCAVDLDDRPIAEPRE